MRTKTFKFHSVVASSCSSCAVCSGVFNTEALPLPVSRLGGHVALRGGGGGQGLQVSGGIGQGAAAGLRGVWTLQRARVRCRDTDQSYIIM